MEYNICYNMDKSCKIILNKHQTYGSQEQAQQTMLSFVVKPHFKKNQ